MFGIFIIRYQVISINRTVQLIVQRNDRSAVFHTAEFLKHAYDQRELPIHPGPLLWPRCVHIKSSVSHVVTFPEVFFVVKKSLKIDGPYPRYPRVLIQYPKLRVSYIILVGGLEHFLFSHILGIIIPID